MPRAREKNMRKGKRLLMVGSLAMAAILAGCGSQARQAEEPVRTFSAAALQGAIDDPGRAAHRAVDARRKPAELIRFAELKPGDKVLDLIPGDGYFTRIFSKVVGPEGKVYAVWPQSYAKLAMGNVATLRQLSADTSYGNIVTEVQPTPVLAAPEKLDMVWTSQNYHDYPDEFMGKTDLSVLNKAVFEILKPGGTYVVIDHAAEPGSGMRDTEKLHRIDPAAVRQQVEAAGFEFAGESEVLHNPQDPLTLTVFDPAIRGRTSQFAYKFRKPE
jgi:predicted methyltransferase